MSKRNYGHVCALTRALDIIGERWTLVVIRELLFGPRRYSDMLRQMPGLGTNLLAQRLKDLEQAGLITHTKLPPPAASAVYELTSEGRTMLTPLIRALTDFGVTVLAYPPQEGEFVPASSTMGALAKFYHPERAQGVSLSVEFDTGDDLFACAIEGGTMRELGFGNANAPDLRLRSTTDTFMGLIVGYVGVSAALDSGELTILEGDNEMAIAFFELFDAPYDQA